MEQMRIIISPYSNMTFTGEEHPKHYPYWEELLTLIKEKYPDVILTQVGIIPEKRLPLVDEFLLNLPSAELKKILLDSTTWIAIDNFFPHFAHYYGKKGIALFSYSDPKLFGHSDNINLFKDKKFFRPNQFDLWSNCIRHKSPYISPKKILQALVDNI